MFKRKLKHVIVIVGKIVDLASMAFRVRMRCLLFYCLVHVSHVSLACILLLNGWTPLSVYDRSALSDIVASGEVLRTFKDVRTEHGTYSAEVRLFTVHKGVGLVREVQQRIGGTGSMVFNVSNFGDKASCYADVTKGELYVLFLTVFEGRLSAKYDDIFGAAADYTQENEKQVLDYLGEFSCCPRSPPPPSSPPQPTTSASPAPLMFCILTPTWGIPLYIEAHLLPFAFVLR